MMRVFAHYEVFQAYAVLVRISREAIFDVPTWTPVLSNSQILSEHGTERYMTIVPDVQQLQ